MTQELFEFAARKLNTEEPEEGRCLHFWTRFKYFESITRNQMNESKTIPKTHELHSVRSIGVENVIQTRNTTCCCLNCITGMGKCEFYEIAGQWECHSVIGEAFLTKPIIYPVHRKINPKGTISEEQIQVNNYRMGKLGKPEKATDKKKTEDDEIDFPLEEISLAMYRKKKMEERKRKMPPEDGTKKSHTCRKKIKLGNDLVSSGKKDKYPNNNPDGVINSGKKKNLDIPEEDPNFNNLREKLHAHKVVQYLEDSSSQQDDIADDSDYYPSSQASQDSLLQIGMKRIESIYKVEERRKEKMETSSRVINQEPKVEERRKEKMETSSRVIKQEPKVEDRRKEKMETSSRVIKQEPKVEERGKEKMDTSSRVINQEPKVEERRKEKWRHHLE